MAWYADCMEESAAQHGGSYRNGSGWFGTDRKLSECNGTVPNNSMGPSSSDSNLGSTPFASENTSEGFRTVPQETETFGTVRNDAEEFRTVPVSAERPKGGGANHILTVSETARRFADAGVPRTERSITNWCRPNPHGVARLDCFLDQNERKYFITPQSVDLAIKEEQAKAEKNQLGGAGEIGRIPTQSELNEAGDDLERGSKSAKALQAKVNRLEIEVAVKDQLIERYDADRSEALERIESAGRYTGRLEARVLEVDGPDKLLELSSGSQKTSHPESGGSLVDENGEGSIAA